MLHLALPAAASAVLPLIHRAVDQRWLRSLGDTALAALTTASISVWLFTGVALLVSIGLGALVARYSGGGRLAGAAYVADQGLRWGVGIGIVAGALGVFATPALFAASGATEAVTEAGVGYVRVFWAGGVALLVQMAADAVWRGHGNTRVPFLVGLISLGVNIALDPLLIFGWGPVPGLGVTGAAWATVLAGVVGAGLNIVLLRRAGHLSRARPSDSEMRLEPSTLLGRPGWFHMDRQVFRRIARVGVPTSCASLFFNLTTLVVLRFVQEAGGEAGAAALGVAHTGEGLAWILGMGWAAAASALVGRQLGADAPEEAERLAWVAAAQCALLSGLWSAVLFFGGEHIAATLLE